jgi:hypothetical protein
VRPIAAASSVNAVIMEQHLHGTSEKERNIVASEPSIQA